MNGIAESTPRDAQSPSAHTHLGQSEMEDVPVGKRERCKRALGGAWELSMACAREGVQRCAAGVDFECCGEQIWKKSDPILMEQGEKAELERFKKMGVNEYAY